MQTRWDKPFTTSKYMNSTRIQWLLALAASAAASAQPPPPRGDRMPPPVPPLLALFDTNHDKEISAEEIQAAAEILAKFDRNHDGKITLSELRMPPANGGKPPKDPKGPPPEKPLGKPHVPPLIAVLDTDHNGTISAAEIANAPESLKTLDKNGDGELTPEEIHPDGPPPRPEGKDGDEPQGPPPAYGPPEVE